VKKVKRNSYTASTKKKKPKSALPPHKRPTQISDTTEELKIVS
jgi:hypothetical protein